MTEGHRFSQSVDRACPRSTQASAWVTLAIIGGVNLAPGIASAQPFIGLGHLPGTSQSYVAGLNHDGIIAVGYCEEDFATGSYIRAFRWSRDRGMEDLGTLPGGVLRQTRRRSVLTAL